MINVPFPPKHGEALQAYEAQVSSMVRGMSRLEEELLKAKEEKAALLSDLASVRELCVKLDSGKELTARQLTSRSMDLERVRPHKHTFDLHSPCSSFLYMNLHGFFLAHRRTGGCSVRI